MPLKFTTKPLSHSEQKLYLYLEAEGKNAFGISELKASNLGFSDSHLYVLLQRLQKKGWITPVGKGVYLRLPASTAIDGKAYLEDPFQVALKLFPRNAYLAFLSGLRVHGLSEHQPFTVFLATKEKSETVELLEQYEIRAVKIGKRFTGYEQRNGYTVSTVAKTFFDCFYHPQFSGGYPEVLKSLSSCRNMDWDELRSYLERFASASLCQKIGYLLSLIAKTGYSVPERTIDFLRSKVRVKTRLDHQIRRGGNFVSEWLVIDNLGERKLLEWWYSG